MQRTKSKAKLADARPTEPSAGMAPVLLRLPDVIRVTGLPRSSIYKMMSERSFPAPCRLGGRAVAWRSAEILQWSQALPSSRP